MHERQITTPPIASRSSHGTGLAVTTGRPRDLWIKSRIVGPRIAKTIAGTRCPPTTSLGSAIRRSVGRLRHNTLYSVATKIHPIHDGTGVPRIGTRPVAAEKSVRPNSRTTVSVT